MLKIKTNLKFVDYENLMFDNYFSENRRRIEEKYKTIRNIMHKKKDIKIKIDGKVYNGEILSYPIVMEYKPNDYTCKLWTIEVKTTFKIIIKVNIKDEDTVKKLLGEQIINYIDRKKCYAGQHVIKDDTIYFTFITLENMQKKTYINLDLVEKVGDKEMISIGNNTKIKNSIIGSKNDKKIKILQQELQRKDNIINELNKDLEYYKHEEELYRYYQQENPRLMNNWNELKKCMKDLLNKANDKTSDLFIYEQNKAIINMFLDKIKELEESGKL